MSDISVVICVRNAGKTIEECLKFVEKNNPSEIILIDGESSDDTVELARRHTDKIFSDKRRGLGYARQLGAEKAGSKYVAYVDSDVILTPDCLSIMVKELEENGYAAIHAQLLCLDDSNYWERSHEQYIKITFNRLGERNWIGAVAAVFKRDVILQNSFDPFFKGAAEDMDLSLRLGRKGFRLGISTAYAYHRHRNSAKDFVKQRIWYGRGGARLFWKYKSLIFLLGLIGIIPYGVFLSIKNRSPGMLPYYVIWSIARNIGFVTEMAQLILQRIILRR